MHRLKFLLNLICNEQHKPHPRAYHCKPFQTRRHTNTEFSHTVCHRKQGGRTKTQLCARHLDRRRQSITTRIVGGEQAVECGPIVLLCLFCQTSSFNQVPLLSVVAARQQFRIANFSLFSSFAKSSLVLNRRHL